jgi:hypothetical protein
MTNEYCPAVGLAIVPFVGVARSRTTALGFTV